MIKTIIFDFDGTIADTFSEGERILTKLSYEFGYKTPAKEDITSLRNHHAQEIMKILHVSPLKVPFIVHRFKEELNKTITTIHPIPGMKQALQELKQKKYTLGIVTTNSESNVLTFLSNNKLEFFDFIDTGSSIFGKYLALKGVLKKHTLPKDEVVYIGDEIRDIEAAKKIGIKVIAVSWGFNSKDALRKYSPTALIDNPKELGEITISLDFQTQKP